MVIVRVFDRQRWVRLTEVREEWKSRQWEEQQLSSGSSVSKFESKHTALLLLIILWQNIQQTITMHIARLDICNIDLDQDITWILAEATSTCHGFHSAFYKASSSSRLKEDPHEIDNCAVGCCSEIILVHCKSAKLSFIIFIGPR